MAAMLILYLMLSLMAVTRESLELAWYVQFGTEVGCKQTYILKDSILWDITPSRPLEANRRFR